MGGSIYIRRMKHRKQKCLSVLPQWLDPSLVTFLFMLNHTLLNSIRDFHCPRAMRWASSNLGTFLAHNGLKWSVGHILPPLYIFLVFLFISGTAISEVLVEWIYGISAKFDVKLILGAISVAAFSKHQVPSLLYSNQNQTLFTFSLLSTYQI